MTGQCDIDPGNIAAFIIVVLPITLGMLAVTAFLTASILLTTREIWRTYHIGGRHRPERRRA